MDTSKVYWIWYQERQVQIAFDAYAGEWFAMFNDSGRAL